MSYLKQNKNLPIINNFANSIQKFINSPNSYYSKNSSYLEKYDNGITANAVLNFDASQLASVGVGNIVKSWNNTGSLGTTYNATSTNSPILGITNGLYHVAFNRSSSQFFTINSPVPLTWFNNAGVYSGMTIFIVAQYTNNSPGSFERFIDFSSGTPIDNLYVSRYLSNNAIETGIYNGNAGLVFCDMSYTNNTNFNIYVINITNSSTGGTINSYFNSATTPNQTTTFSTPINNRTTINNFIGKSAYPADSYLNGNIRQILIYNSSLSSNDMYTVYINLQNKWNYTYLGNNGTVSGDTYCQGGWESTTGQNKNMICIGGINQNTVGYVPCGAVIGQGNNLVYNCQNPYTLPTTTPSSTTTTLAPTTTTLAPTTTTLAPTTTTPVPTPMINNSYTYFGNNGTVSGDTYCQGGWENPTGQNKNMKCIGGINQNSGANIPCNITAGQGNNLAYNCQTTSTTPNSITVQYLIVGGGGGGGGNGGGGGGAGGLLASNVNLITGSTYTITIGAGGIGQTNQTPSSGGNTSVIGKGVYLVANGGGGGASRDLPVPPNSGGSGGGGGGGPFQGYPQGLGANGTSGQGNNGGNSTGDIGINSAGGGGGGAGGQGGNASSQTGGTGGVGLTSTITGTPIIYSSGGSGGCTNGNNGIGGGVISGVNAMVNTGGGGAGNAGSGASGIVILSVPTNYYTGSIITGSPIVKTNGSNTVLIYNNSGTITLSSTSTIVSTEITPYSATTSYASTTTFAPTTILPTISQLPSTTNAPTTTFAPSTTNAPIMTQLPSTTNAPIMTQFTPTTTITPTTFAPTTFAPTTFAPTTFAPTTFVPTTTNAPTTTFTPTTFVPTTNSQTTTFTPTTFAPTTTFTPTTTFSSTTPIVPASYSPSMSTYKPLTCNTSSENSSMQNNVTNPISSEKSNSLPHLINEVGYGYFTINKLNTINIKALTNCKSFKIGLSLNNMSNPLQIVKIINNPNNNNEYKIYYSPNIKLKQNTGYYFEISDNKLIYFTSSETLQANHPYYLEVPDPVLDEYFYI